ncbi:MAG: hypothetical protein WA790_02750 [Sulfitobacter sp.]
MIKRSGAANLDGWRLPAPELEAKLGEVIRSRLTSPSFPTQLIPDGTVVETARWRDELMKVCKDKTLKQVINLVQRVDIKAGDIKIILDATTVGTALSAKEERFDANALAITSPFQIRKRGVETKLILGDTSVELDETLISNIAKAHQWYEQIKAGKTLSDIARASDTSSRRIQQMIEVALLAPDIIKLVLDGKQPLGFTSEWCKRHPLPSSWQDQRALIATL